MIFALYDIQIVIYVLLGGMAGFIASLNFRGY